MFTTSLGTPITPSNLMRAFRQLIKIAAVRRIRIHDLRHTYVSLARKRGVPIEVVSERLGHSNPGFTLNTYRHLFETDRKEAGLDLDELLGTFDRRRVTN